MKTSITVPLDIKALSDREFEGHGSIFGNTDLGGDIVARGAFKRSLSAHKSAGTMPAMLWMHDPARVLGRWDEMAEDARGLRVKGVLADTPLGNEIHTLLKMDALSGLSIGYRTVDQEWRDDVRVIKDAELWEVSVVTFPMNPLAQIAHVKSQLSAAGEYVPTAREFERTLRDVGCSKSIARRIVALIRDLDESGEKPGSSLVVPAEPETEALKALAEKITADAIRRKFAA